MDIYNERGIHLGAIEVVYNIFSKRIVLINK